ncbi:MAG TPA: PorP/SprF family type IX secretion system membrane protein [Chitinophagales bacterium]|nr:PorP/SprF family type IX secretion system membrane protein [Chitinophagales bacterium]
MKRNTNILVQVSKSEVTNRHGLWIFIFCAITQLLSLTPVKAQDIHFSQYFHVPLSLNPALTGKLDGTFRVGIDYRNQWFGIGARNPYSTPSFFGDVPVRFKSKDILGIGLSIISDKSSGGRLSTFTGLVSAAYHKALGNKNHFLSLGIQFGYSQKKLDLADIKLGDQIFLQDEIIGVSSDNLKGSDGGFDLNAGFDWSSKFSENVFLHAGYAVFHVTQPGISFHADAQRLPMRHSASFEADFKMAEHFKLLPFFHYMTQAKSEEIYTGLSMGFPFSSEAGINVGAYYRMSDAVVPYFGFNIKGFKIGFSYDITTSPLKKTSGSIELSVTYTGRYVPVPDVTPSLYCPRF